mmetsp:Transcript_68147/g.134532  ORF Transcript_68147/g.134532 Transcript_68147/m.134532 type:complete len:807 (+) Transcript_68147:83-2503(+)
MGATQTCCAIQHGKMERVPTHKVKLGKAMRDKGHQGNDDATSGDEGSEEISVEEEDDEEEVDDDADGSDEYDDDEEREECIAIWVRVISAKGFHLDDAITSLSCEWGVAEHDKQVKVLSANREPLWNVEMALTGKFKSEELQFVVHGKRPPSSGGDVRLGDVSLRGSAFLPDGFNGDVLLQNTNSSTKAYLSVCIRPDGVDTYPTSGAPADGYSCVLSQPEEQGWQLCLDSNPVDHHFARIVSAPSGAFEFHNASAESDFVVRENDFIYAINGCREVELFRKILETQSKQLKLEARKCTKHKHKIPKQGPMGLELFYDNGPCSTVVVRKVNQGSVRQWNDNFPEKSVEPLDRIIAVDGKTGKADVLVKAMQESSSEVELTIVRPAAGGVSGGPVPISGLTKISTNDFGLLKQPPNPKAKIALIQVYVRTEDFGGPDKGANRHCCDSVPIANGFIAHGMSCQLLHYVHEEHEQFMEVCKEFDAILIRCSAEQIVADGGNFWAFDAGIRKLQLSGVRVWPSPDDRERLNARDALARISHLSIGLPDTNAYFTEEDLREGLRKSLAFQPRVISRGDGANDAVWVIKLVSGKYCSEYGARECDDFEMLNLTEANDNHQEVHSFAEFIEFCARGVTEATGTWSTKCRGKYFDGGRAAGGYLVDQRLCPRSAEGEVHCTMIGDVCVDIVHKAPPGVSTTNSMAVVQRFASTADFFLEDLDNLVPALGLSQSLPLTWSVSFVVVSPDESTKASERWTASSLTCSAVALPYCQAGACTPQDKTASFSDISAESRAEANRLGRILGGRALSLLQS